MCWADHPQNCSVSRTYRGLYQQQGKDKQPHRRKLRPRHKWVKAEGGHLSGRLTGSTPDSTKATSNWMACLSLQGPLRGRVGLERLL